MQIIDYFSARVGALRLAFMQFLVTSLLSFFVAWLIEDWIPFAWGEAWTAVLYAGLFSVGIGYTMQVIGQKDARPARAALLLSLKSVFAELGGWLILRDTLSPRSIFGAALMLTGTWISLASRKDTERYPTGTPLRDRYVFFRITRRRLSNSISLYLDGKG